MQLNFGVKLGLGLIGFGSAALLLGHLVNGDESREAPSAPGPPTRTTGPTTASMLAASRGAQAVLADHDHPPARDGGTGEGQVSSSAGLSLSLMSSSAISAANDAVNEL